MAPKPKNKSQRRRRRGGNLFPPSGGNAAAANAAIVSRVRVPPTPPTVANAPPFRRTVRFILNVTTPVTVNLSQIVIQDKTDYGIPSTGTNRWQGVNVLAARVYLASMSPTPADIQIAVESLTNSAQTSAVFQDQSTISGWVTIGWKWPRNVQQNNLQIGTSTVLFTVTNNNSSAQVNGFVDVDCVFTG